MADFSDSQTYRNLVDIAKNAMMFSSEYRIYASQARKDGYQQIGNIFDETAGNELSHAVIMLDFINQGDKPTTLENLKNAAALENNEWLTVQRNYVEVARSEGYEEIANVIEGIAGIDRHHKYRFNQLADNMENGRVFCKNSSVVWVCLQCGNLVWNKCAPEICPVCGYPQGYYQLNCENY